MIRKSIFTVALTSLLFIQCNTNTDFVIAKDQVGKLQKSNTIEELETIFAADSIVRDTTLTRIGAAVKKINIYEKGGKQLLTLTPNTDSIPKIGIIRIYDPRYVTEKGVGLNSTFKDIEDKHTIKKITSALNNIVIFLKDSDAYFTIAKTELPSNLQYGSSTNIEAVQIPDNAKIKYMMVGWD
ncbi:hypothetical protein H4O18_17605 [Arenibacter sp. BSSL-BM3]|uniref:Uncharacterized protein n=1 Tax=Arenibacter arenosicollis TaxID=2762274 RepID=A0ABR7QRX3_9FLAO|nr:hypothetical protein [Arenibacter arenosicollis]MBC8769819.1 hypothetical protein [Arenibacter arenosicollis]